MYSFSDIALLNIYFEVSEEKLEDVFIEFSKRLKDIEITKELLQRSKRAFEKQISEEANNCEKWCDELGWEIALSRIPAQTIEEIKKRYENIDIDRLNKCAKKLFKNKNANVQIIGKTDKCDIEKCRKLWKDEHRDIFL